MLKTEINEKKREKLQQLNFESNQLTRDCIRTALLALMGTEIFDQITVTSIIQKAGVSRGGFYRNYTSKEDVLREIGEGLFKYLLEFVSEHKIHENPRDWYLEYFKTINKYKNEYKLLIKAKAPTNFVFHFDEGQLIRKLQKDDSIMERYRAVSIVKSLEQVTFVWFQNGMKETPEEMTEIMIQIFFNNQR